MQKILGILKKNILLLTLKRTFRLLNKKQKRQSYFLLFLLFLNSLFDLLGLGTLLPLGGILLDEDIIETNPVLQRLYNFLPCENNEEFVLYLCSIIILCIIAKNFISLLITRYQVNYSLGLYKQFGQKSLRYYYQKGLGFFKKQNTHEVIRNVETISSRFAIMLVIPTLNVLNEITVLLLIVIFLFMVNTSALLLLFAAVGPVFYLFYTLVKKKVKAYEEIQIDLQPKLTNNLYQAFQGYSEVMISGTKKFFFSKYFAHQEEIKRTNVWLHVFRAAPIKVIETSVILGLLVIISYGVFYYPDAERSKLIALLGAFGLAAYRTMPSINRILMAVMNLKGNSYIFDHLEPLFHAELEAPVAQKTISFEHNLTVDNVGFSYDDGTQQILKGITFTIEKGEVFGIVGESGSGKTTLLNVMLGFMAPKSGAIRLDGTALDNSTLEDWRKKIGYVQQEVFLVQGSIKENVAFGIPQDKIDDELLEKTLKMASLHDLILSLPNGVETQVGEKGAQLSGGQRQRVGIARALYSGASILFFDEATSALDNKTENEVTEAILKLKEERITMIIVAHRYTTLKPCDRIIEVEKGQIKQELNYENLIQTIL